MGTQEIKKFSDPATRKKFTKYLINDIKALEKMLNENLIESGITRIGAEQELCLINKKFEPVCIAVELLEAINDPHFVPELAQFNIEANLDPLDFEEECFVKLELQLRELMSKAHFNAEKLGVKILMTGILPTLQKEHLQFNNMAPNPRYQALDEVMRGERGSDFELNITGVDKLIANHNNILFEACNTSFQIHMQISPEEFRAKYNWAQMIAGPILAATANSPILLGKRLWDETRISLFQQSVDTRTSSNIKREQEPRVTFGAGWLEGTVVDHYKDNISRFNPLFASQEMEDSLAVLESGGIPKLEALNMHNGTVYKWNRACYGVGNGKPHVRIENRYIPSGPTIKDEIANTAFWLGVMYGMPKEYKNLPEMVKFEDCRFNFYSAARNGLDSHFNWFDEVVSAKDLLLKTIIPLARKGLKSAGISPKSITELMNIIEERVRLSQSGSKWMKKNFTTLLNEISATEASRCLTKELYKNQMSSICVHEWDNIDLTNLGTKNRFQKVRDIMQDEPYVAKENDVVELVVNLMDWKNIHSIPVENNKNELVGLITEKEVLKYFTENGSKSDLVSDLMSKDYITIEASASSSELLNLFIDTKATCVLVTENKFLLGVVGKNDIIKAAHTAKLFNCG